jgi:carboxyl-terminal processing protease
MNNYFNSEQRSSKQTIIKIVIGLALLTLAFFAGAYSAGKSDAPNALNIFEGRVLNKPQADNDVDFKLFWDVWNTLKRDYVDQNKLTEKKLFYGALQGLVGSTDDPYSVFMNPEQAKEFQEDLSGTFEGIGAEIGFRNDILTIIAPLEDMPALKAGVRSGDKIYAIDGHSAAGMTVEEAVKKIRGPKGTQVKLTLVRDKVEKPIELSITRDTVMVKSVKTSFNDKTNIFTIKISNFNDDTESLFSAAVQEALLKKPKGLILDLRNNPGGYLESAVTVASEWIKEGPIVIEEFGDGRKIEHASRGSGRLAGMPTIVLVNQGSASASEIVAGALKDDQEAKLVGEKTFGKGSVQILRQMEDGSVVKVTTAKWLTPKGTSINEQGIEPDTKIEFSASDREQNKDPQADEAVKILLHGL